MTFIWATRGRSWGFRFLRDGGLAEPLFVYEKAFESVEPEYRAYRRSGDVTAVRFPDLNRPDFRS